MKKALWLMTVLLPVICACGPISASKAISRANEAINTAERINADTKCPYEYNFAVLNLDYARSREGCSEFETSVEFAKKALKAAQIAAKKATLLEDGDQARMDKAVTE